jgi:glycosyltransferase involved in cell wall biosynthesis
MSLKILQLTNRVPYPLNDGGNIATYNVTYFLNLFGNDVTLLTLNTKKHFHTIEPLETIAKVYAVDIDTTVTIWGLVKSLFQKMPYNVKRFYDKQYETKLIELLKSNQFDIVQIEGSYMVMYAPLIKKHSNAKIVLRSHNIEHMIWQRMSKNEKSVLKKVYYKAMSNKIKWFENKTMFDVDAIVAITKQDADYYIKNGFIGEIKTINAGVNLNKFIPDQTKKIKNSIGFIAGLDWLPNIQGLDWFLSEIWPVIKVKHPELQLHLAGKAMPQKYFNIKDSSIVIHGVVSDAVNYIQKCEIFIVPLLSGGGMRLKVVEAMSLGKCIISTAVGAEGIEYTNGKDILIANNTSEWIEQINWIVTHQNQIDEIEQCAILLAHNKYNWEQLVKEFELLYTKILN